MEQDNCTLVHCFFFNDTATTEIYTLSLHDALPICRRYARSSTPSASPWASSAPPRPRPWWDGCMTGRAAPPRCWRCSARSEEHTSELQSRQYLVCPLLLEKKKTFTGD